ncbi:MAG: class I SAM-dependent methyltransferase [Terracidiphilus sp.]
MLRHECGLSPDAFVVDVAAGTGLLTEIFLAADFAVTAIEPNAEMRAACSELETIYPKLRCIQGTAEETGLPYRSAALITVAQAMHWFDLERTQAEFARILKPRGCCAVIYNNRHVGGDEFHDAYEQFLMEFGIDYESVKQQHVGRKRLSQFFAPAQMHCAEFPNSQALMWDAFEGRVFSSSYIPRPGHEHFHQMQSELQRLFDRHQSGGVVSMGYDCVVCYGQIAKATS